MKRISIILIGALSLAGCSLLSPVKTAPSHRYLLNSTSSNVVAHHRTANTILVAPIQSPAAYNSTAIAYTTQPYQIDYFVNSHWAETPAQMLQPLIVQTLQSTHRFRAVIAPPVDTSADLALHTELLQLQQEFLQKPSQVRLTLRVQLINTHTNQVIATRQFSVVKVAPQDNPYGGVVAANCATTEALQQIANLCLRAS